MGEFELSCYSSTSSKCELKDFKPWDDGKARPKPILRHEHAKDANRALDSIESDARSQGFEPPSFSTKLSARRILNTLAKDFRCQFDVEPTEEGEIAIEASGGYRRGVLIVLRPDGSATTFLTIDGVNERNPSKSSDDLPDEFVTKSIRRIIS